MRGTRAATALVRRSQTGGRSWGMLTLAVSLAVALTQCSSGPGTLKLDGTPKNEEAKEGINGRRLILNSATYQYNLPSLVGHALYVRKQGNSCPGIQDTNYSATQISAEDYIRDGVELKLLDRLGPPLYESKIDRGAKVDVSYLLFSGGGHANEVAEVALTDVVALPLPNNSLVGGYAQQILAGMKENECDAAIVTGATVSTLSYKWYKRWDGKTKISGVAFGADGEIWQENSKSNLQFLIAVDLAAVRPSLPPGVHPAMRPLQMPRLLLAPPGGFRIRAHEVASMSIAPLDSSSR